MSAVTAECLRDLLDATATGQAPQEVAERARRMVAGLWIDSLMDASADRFVGLASDLRDASAEAARTIAGQADGLHRASSRRNARIAEQQAEAMRTAAMIVAGMVGRAPQPVRRRRLAKMLVAKHSHVPGCVEGGEIPCKSVGMPDDPHHEAKTGHHWSLVASPDAPA